MTLMRSLSVAAALALGTTAQAQETNPMVGGAAMYANMDIIDNAVNSADHTTLVAAVQAADLVETLNRLLKKSVSKDAVRAGAV